MNNFFDIKRFTRYYISDIKQIFSNVGLSLMLLSLGGLISYLIWVGFSLCIYKEWDAPILGFNIIVFSILSIIMLISMQAKCYGHITDKRQGSNWLMVPVSKFEKFLSMLINIFIIIPIIFFGIYLGIDYIISLLDTTYSASIISTIDNSISLFLEEIKDSDTMLLAGRLILSGINDIILYLAIFLIGALYFKKNKVVKTILSILALSIILSICASPFIVNFIKEEEMNLDLIKTIITKSLVIDYVFIIGLLYWIYYRVKTITH